MLPDAAMIAMLIICIITDIRGRRIPNKVVFPTIALALIWHTFQQGTQGLLFSAEGLALGLGLLLIPFVLGGLGAGDVKLLAAVGAIKGPAFVFAAFIGMAITGGLIALVILISQKRLWATLKRIGVSLYILFLSRFHVNGLATLDRQDLSATFPYGVAIGIGSLGALVGGWQFLLK